MLRYKVVDPKDIRNPIPFEIRKGMLFVYHGTSLQYTDAIEKQGFKPNQLPYSMEDIETVNNAYKITGWYGISGRGYPVISVFTTGADKSRTMHKSISFAYHYEYARNYAVNPGGETIENLMIAIDEFKQFIDSELIRRQHVSELQSRLQRFPPVLPYKNKHIEAYKKILNEQIDASLNLKLLEGLLIKISKVQEKYLSIFKNHRPVVYAVRARPEWFDRKPELAIDMHAVCPIEPKHLFARVDFPNGAEHVFVTVNQLEESPFR